jgi:inosine-uridine nucleoside N-ribohydrolase
VIIDTDGGIDDIRAITMLLASPDVRVLAITVSPRGPQYR